MNVEGVIPQIVKSNLYSSGLLRSGDDSAVERPLKNSSKIVRTWNTMSRIQLLEPFRQAHANHSSIGRYVDANIAYERNQYFASFGIDLQQQRAAGLQDILHFSNPSIGVGINDHAADQIAIKMLILGRRSNFLPGELNIAAAQGLGIANRVDPLEL